jgi:tetratricopeptide (TPR) repeat protein
MPYFGFFQARLKHIPELSEFTEQQRRQAKSIYLEALALDEKQDDERAIDRYTQAIDVVPVFWEALDNRGLCYMRLRNFLSAIPSFETSTQIFPSGPLALAALIKCYRETQQNVHAMHVADYFRQTWPDHSPFPEWSTVLGKDI